MLMQRRPLCVKRSSEFVFRVALHDSVFSGARFLQGNVLFRVFRCGVSSRECLFHWLLSVSITAYSSAFTGAQSN